MTILRYEGIVRLDCCPDELYIGDIDVLRNLFYEWEEKLDGLVTVAFADERFEGDLEVSPGLEGYSEWTPGEMAEFLIGEHNLIDRLEEYEGKRVILWIADEPINTLDPPPSWANQG